MCYDMAHALSDVLGTVASSTEEIHGFRYWDARSILGFVDGTENPHEQERAIFGLVGNDDPVYKGGSYLFVQKYIHDLNAFEKLSTEEQERVIGRYKMNDIEMPDNIKPSNSHIALTNVGLVKNKTVFRFRPGCFRNKIDNTSYSTTTKKRRSRTFNDLHLF